MKYSTGSSMKTRLASLSDIAPVERLINRAYRSKEGIQGCTHEGHLLERDRTDEVHLRELIDTPNSQLLLCYSSNEALVGSVHLTLHYDHIYFGMLAVDPLHLSKGIGVYLFQAAKDFAILNVLTPK